jgi:hypothetical protein
MNPVEISPSEDPGARVLTFRFRGRDIASFQVSTEFVANELDSDPQPDPFEVLEALQGYLDAYGSYGEGKLLDVVQLAYGNHHDEVMSLYLHDELQRHVEKRAELEQQIREVMHIEIALRNELQSLPINDETAPRNGTVSI